MINAANQVLIYPVTGGQPQICRGIGPGERPIQWSTGDDSLYVYRPNTLPVTIYRVNLTTWRRTVVEGTHALRPRWGEWD